LKNLKQRRGLSAAMPKGLKHETHRSSKAGA
jgi:hypothetical protein